MSALVRRFIDATSDLPRELAARSEELRELDEQGLMLAKRIDKNHASLLRGALHKGGRRGGGAAGGGGGDRPAKRPRPSPSSKAQELEEQVREDMGEVQQLAKGRLACASQMYESIDRLIQRADKHLKSLQDDIERERARLQLAPDETAQVLLGVPGGARDARGKARGGYGGPKSLSTRKDGKKGGRSGRPSLASPRTHATPASVGRLPVTGAPAVAGEGGVATVGVLRPELGLVDNAEPRYCICENVSHGEMIACDNPECAIEWFHFECVGISKESRPKGKWYCPECAPRMKKGRSKQA